MARTSRTARRWDDSSSAGATGAVFATSLFAWAKAYSQQYAERTQKSPTDISLASVLVRDPRARWRWVIDARAAGRAAVLITVAAAVVAVLCVAVPQASAAQANLRLTLDGTRDVLRSEFIVTAKASTGVTGPEPPPCRLGDIMVTLNGPSPAFGTGHAERIAQPLAGASVQTSAFYRYSEMPSPVTAHAIAKCQGLGSQPPVEKFVSMQIPAARPKEPPTPQREEPPPGSLTDSVRDNVYAGGLNTAGGGAVACGLGLAATAVPPYVAAPLAIELCGSAIIGTVGAGTILAVDPPDPDFRTLYPADFPPESFKPKRRELIRCQQLSRRQSARLRTSCRDINKNLRWWVADANELAWLYKALGVTANRWNTARASASQLSAEELDRTLLLHQAAARVYVGQATRVLKRRASTGKQLRREIRGTALDVKFSRAFRTKALAGFGRLDGVPQSVQVDLARAGLNVAGAVAWVTQRMRRDDLPASLSDLLAALPTRFVASQDLLFPTLSRAQQVLLLQSWVGASAHGLSQECGHLLNIAIRRAATYRRDTYAGTLAEHLDRDGPDTACIDAPIIPVAREGYVPGPRRVLIGSAHDATGGLETGQDIHISSRGELLVVDETAHLIRRFTLEGSPIGTFGSATLSQPVQIATDSTGATFVSDWTRHEVQRFSADGVFETAWGGLGAGPGQFDRPSGVAVTPEGHVVVADANNRRLQVFDRDGALLRTITPPPAPAPGFLSMPRGIAVAADGTIAVADLAGARVVLFRADGSFVGQTAPSVGLQLPYDVQYDPDGMLWVADRAGSRSLRLPTLEASDRAVAALGPEPAIAVAPTALAFTASSMLTLDFGSQQVFATPRALGGPEPLPPPPPPPIPLAPVPAPSGHSPVPDVTAPKLTDLTLLPSRFRVSSAAGAQTASAAKTAPRGARLKFKLSEEATVTFDVSRLTSGRRVGKACKQTARWNQRRTRCTRRVAVTSLEGHFLRGAQSVAFRVRLARDRQRAGRYQLLATPTDVTGNRGNQRTATFVLARR